MALEVLARPADLTPAIGVELAPVTNAGNVPMAILNALGLDTDQAERCADEVVALHRGGGVAGAQLADDGVDHPRHHRARLGAGYTLNTASARSVT